MFYRPGKRFFSLRGFELMIMSSIFSGVFGLPYRLASLLILLMRAKRTCPAFYIYQSVTDYLYVQCINYVRYTCTLYGMCGVCTVFALHLYS